jgi:hypothetical protein
LDAAETSMSATCKGCGAPIVWITMHYTGKAMPCDPEVIVERLDETAGTAARNVTLVTEGGLVVTGRRVEDLHAGIEVRAVAGRVPHWSSCPEAKTFKREKLQ